METTEKIESWDGFWLLFNNVCDSLIARKQYTLIDKLKDAKSWVDNSGDEWFEFSYSLDYIVDDDSNLFNEYENQSLLKLQNYLDDFLYPL